MDYLNRLSSLFRTTKAKAKIKVVTKVGAILKLGFKV